jgi:signal peptide peptidase SppA
MKSYARLAERLYNAPLAITRAKAEVLEAVFRNHLNGTPDAEALASVVAQHEAEEAFRAAELMHFAAASGVKIARSDAGYLLADNGVAIVPVMGTLVQRAGFLEAASGMTGYGRIGGMIASALDDPQARGILLEIDSPGGEVAGCFDLCAKIIEAGKVKPIWAIANEAAFSAAYAIAASASKLYAPQTGMVGSVGVIAMHVDQSKRDASQGYVFTPIFAGSKKNDFSSHAPLSERAKNEAQDDVDRAYGIFVEHVAAGRNISTQAVRATEAGILNPEQAKAIGFVDGEASFSETLQAFGESIAPRGNHSSVHHYAAADSAPKKGFSNMATEDNQVPAVPAAAPAANVSELAQAAEARGLAAGRAEGVKAERARIGSILGAKEADGRTDLARHLAFETDMTPEAAVVMLGKAPVASATAAPRRNVLAGIMEANGNPDVRPDATVEGAAGTDADDPAAHAERIANVHALVRGARK